MYYFKTVYLLILTSTILIIFSIQLKAQQESYLTQLEHIEKKLFSSENFNNNAASFSKLPKTNDEWKGRIDRYWGVGTSTEEKLRIFDSAWNYFNNGYGAFINLDLDWNAIKTKYRLEIEAGVSKGRFAAILNYMSYALQDGHTFLADISVSWGTQIQPGVPIFVVSSAKDNSSFGACLTVQPDSTLLVLRSRPNHVLGLEPGDIVLGYDNRVWKNIYKELIEVEMPIRLNYVFGSTPESMAEVMLRSAGLNWHLFETIDILKYSGELEHYPTSLLKNQSGIMWGNEQLDIPGVEQPNFWTQDHITWGIVENENVGYIYIASWDWRDEYQISEKFYAALNDIMFNYETDGLIIDMRLNYGGNMAEAHDGYSLMFNQSINTAHFDLRDYGADHLDMIPHPYWPINSFKIIADPNTFYDKPIAVLTGPGAVSNGDWESVRMGLHPKARVFGKPTNGAFTLSDNPNIGPGYYCTRATGSGYMIDTHDYMCHKSAPIDEIVWFNKEDVHNGTDTVVERAIEWIHNPTKVSGDINVIPNEFKLSQNYPNPFNPITTIEYTVPFTNSISGGNPLISLNLYDILGNHLRTLVNEEQSSGTYRVSLDGTDLASGTYFYTLSTNSARITKKMMVLK